jgi:hypothetical protein
MIRLDLIDIAPGPARPGGTLSAILFAMVFLVLLGAALAVFLWFRKRSIHSPEIVHRETFAPAQGNPIQPNNPNQL